jgi:hypothetical protein
MTPRMLKIAQLTVDPYSPEEAGKAIANIVKFITRRIPFQKRPYSIMNLRNKINSLSEFDMASKKTPPTASLGQSITFIKTILNGKDSNYIRTCIKHIINNLE